MDLVTSAFVLTRLEAVLVRTPETQLVMDTSVIAVVSHSLPVYLGHLFQKFGSIIRRVLQKIFSLISTRPYRLLGQRVQWTSGAGSLGRGLTDGGLKLTTYLHPVPWLRIRGDPPPLSPSTFLAPY